VSTALEKTATVSEYLKAHEHLLIVVILVVLSWFSFGKIENIVAAHDNANLQQAKIVAQVQQDKNDALAKQVADQKATYEALYAQVSARDSQLQQLQVTLVTALTKQQAADKVLTPPALVARLNTLVPTAGATVQPNGVLLPEQGAVSTVVELEKVPVLTQQLATSSEELSDANKLVAAEGNQVTALNAEVVGLQAAAVDQTKVCSARVALVKAEARKSKRRWFYAGVVVGFIGRQLIKP
jgi:hypothetical protein